MVDFVLLENTSEAKLAWQRFFRSDHPLGVIPGFLEWFYGERSSEQSGFYVALEKKVIVGFLGYRANLYPAYEFGSYVRETWICGLGADDSYVGLGYLLLKKFCEQQAPSDVLGVNNYRSDLQAYYQNLGFEPRRMHANLFERKLSPSESSQSGVEFFNALPDWPCFFEYFGGVPSDFDYSATRRVVSQHPLFKYRCMLGSGWAALARFDSVSNMLLLVYAAGNFSDMAEQVLSSVNGSSIRFVCMTSTFEFRPSSNCSNWILCSDGPYEPRIAFRQRSFASCMRNSSRHIFLMDGDQERGVMTK